MKRYMLIIALIVFFTGMQHYAHAGGSRTFDVVADPSTFTFVDIDGSGDVTPGEPFYVEGRVDRKNTTDSVGTFLCRGWFIIPQADGAGTYVSQSYEINGKGTIYVQGNEGETRFAVVGATGSFPSSGQAEILPHPDPTLPIAFRIKFHFRRDGHGDGIMVDPTEESFEAPGQESEQSVVPVELQQNYPNPFNPETEISFTLPKTSVVVMKIYNSLGQEVRTLTDGQYEAGTHTLRWDGLNNQGSAVASGVYLQRLEVDGLSVVKKMNLVR